MKEFHGARFRQRVVSRALNGLPLDGPRRAFFTI
jgi:hypothetical protein